MWIGFAISGIASGFAQVTSTLYQDFNQTILNPYVINPAATDTGYSFNFRFNNVNELGVFRNISRFYLDADTKLGAKDNNGNHFLGLQIANSKQGDYINRSRMQLRYSWFLPVSDKATLSSGVSLGFVNYAFLTSQGGTGGSDIGPDGSLGFHYIRKLFVFGFSIQQIFNTVIIPVDQSFKLERLYNLEATKIFPLSFDVKLTTQLIAQVPETFEEVFPGLSLMGSYKDQVVVGVGNYFLQKTSFNAGVQQINLLNAKISVLLTYTLYHSQVALGDNTFEIFLGLKK